MRPTAFPLFLAGIILVAPALIAATPSTNTVSRAAAKSPQITLVEVEQYSTKLAEGLNKNLRATLRTEMDVAELLNRSVRGIDSVDPKIQDEFRRGVEKSLLENRALDAKLQFTVLRVTVEGAIGRIFFRILSPAGVLNYSEYLVERGNNGFKIVDYFMFMTGTLASEECRPALATAAKLSNMDLFRKLFSEDGAMMEGLLECFRMISIASTNPKAALEIYEKLPPEVQVKKLALIGRFIAAEQMGEAAVTDARLAWESHYPNDPYLGLTLIPILMKQEHYHDAVPYIERLERIIPEDAYLLCLHGWISLLEKQNDTAKELAHRAVAREPSLGEAYKLLMTIQAGYDLDYPGAAFSLREWRKYDKATADREVATSKFGAFRRSEAYKQLIGKGTPGSAPVLPAAAAAAPPPIEVVYPEKLALKSIMGVGAKRMALINNETFRVGDEFSIQAGKVKVRVKCLEIRDQSVLVQITGKTNTQELFQVGK
jgi:tetratricopeptide (TPR) repeat protein